MEHADIELLLYREMPHTGHKRLPERPIIGPFGKDFVDGRVMGGQGCPGCLADPGKFESERLCSYNRGATWGDVGCLYFCSSLFWRPLACGPSNCTFPM